MFYYCIKLLAHCSLLFFFRRKIRCGFPLHTLKGPAIIASNHPNSMLDAVVIGCECKQPVHFMIRSDMFNKPVFRLLLKFLNGIPVYRASEEKEKLRDNFSSFDLCRNILKNKGIIIIFSEGITVHEWKLKPLKSGTAKIVHHALHDRELRHTLQVVPVGLTYSDYEHPAKTLIIQTGEIFYPGKLPYDEHTGAWKHEFNAQLLQQFYSLVPALETNKEKVKNVWQAIVANITLKHNCNNLVRYIHYQAGLLSAQDFESPVHQKLKRYFLPLHYIDYCKSYAIAVLLCIPALAGLVLNSLFYFPMRTFCRIKTKGTIFFDALLFGLLTMIYPLYILLASVLLNYFTPAPFWSWILIIPLTGWCSTKFWVQTTKIKNYLALKPLERNYILELINRRGS
ncbi:1-acyl-sn-glycerol-3-phosphate acyltransferase [Agriterribacter sp.]|uniref:1-acyl-sn-glycerol-3-phosphate acyltransferase n=1 Tax=Agriterribacter sp. TaxID=2821509 RepID=UPI002CAFF127|nr:1-acyl-sn-glycerol-3-phosphate acyltransferase [Agriterribacter sp.]HRP56320.1 1-acyl-sn-glycerol-3-phosphate acyltransferase [Agriterribacter sp.]